MENSKTDNLAAYLREELLSARNDAGLTQEEMASELDISPRAFSSLEGGHSTFGLRTFLLFYLRFCKNQECFFDNVEKIIEEILKESA